MSRVILHDQPTVSFLDMDWTKVLYRTQHRRVRRPPIAAYDGQDFTALAKGMNVYVDEPMTLFSDGYYVDLHVCSVSNATFLIGDGVDGVIFDEAGCLIKDPSCFRSVEALKALR